MGIPLTSDEVNNNCPTCFAVDKTPIKMWLSVTGVKQGASWIPAFGLPPNGVFQLTNVVRCIWGLLTPNHVINLFLNGPSPQLVISNRSAHNPFVQNAVVPCARHFVNDLTGPPGVTFYGGTASLTYRQPLTGSSLLKVAGLVQIPEDGKTFVEFFPFDSTKNVYRYARQKDATLAHILFDYTV